MEEGIQHKRGTVLFVDDERRVLTSMRAMVRRDYEVLLANSGAEALDVLRDADVDVIVSDQRMPGMTGVEVLKQVKTLAPRAMRILLTGYADLQAIEASINEGEVFRYLTKPCATDVLREAIDLGVEASREEHAPGASREEHAPVASRAEHAPVASREEHAAAESREENTLQAAHEELAVAPPPPERAAVAAAKEGEASEEITLFTVDPPSATHVPLPADLATDDPLQLIEIVPSGAKTSVRTARNVTPRTVATPVREPSKSAAASAKTVAAKPIAKAEAPIQTSAPSPTDDHGERPTPAHRHARPTHASQSAHVPRPRGAAVVVPRRVRAPAVDIRDVDLLVLTTDARTVAVLEAALDGSHRLHTASHLDDALAALEKHPIGVVVTDMVVREEHIRHLTTELKRQVPDLVTIVASDRSDAQLLIELINYGQIFRFLLKPLHAGQCRLSIESAVSRHRELALNPARTRRHAVAKRDLPRASDGVMHQVMDRVRRLRDLLFTAEA